MSLVFTEPQRTIIEKWKYTGEHETILREHLHLLSEHLLKNKPFYDLCASLWYVYVYDMFIFVFVLWDLFLIMVDLGEVGSFLSVSR